MDHRFRILAVCFLCAAGCSDGGSGPDAAAPLDTGTAADAGTTDTGVPDAGEPDTCFAGADDCSGADTGPVCTDLDGGTPVPLDTDPVFVKGPYLMYTSPTSVVVMWETADAATSTVEYGPTEALGGTATGTEAGPADGDPGTVHEVTVTGLTSGDRYFYRAGDGTTWSGVHRFRAAPPPLTPFRFAALGDTQSHPEIHARLIPLMAQWGAELVVHVGDEIGDGTVAAQWQTEFYDPIRPLAHRVPYFISIGNHEHESPLFYRFVSYPTAEESYYTFTWGDVFFGVLDPQHEWVVKQLGTEEAKAAKWRVAFFHEPAYTESWGGCTYDGNPTIRSALIPALERGGVNLVLNGHTHEYERGLLNGVYHVITGGGGGDLEPDWCIDFPQITVRKAVHHFLALEASCETLGVKAVDIDGNEFDSFEIPPGFPIAPDGGTDTDGRVVWDAGTSDTGVPDSGESDAGAPDTGETDGGAPDGGDL